MFRTVRSVSIMATAMAALLLARPAVSQQPIAPVPLTPFGDGQDSVLTQALRYQIEQTAFVIVVPAGFVTDFASTPRGLWSVLPPTGRYQLAAVVHDFMYWDQACSREQADAVFRVAMSESSVKPLERDLMWQAVRRFGQSAWDQNAAAKRDGRPRIIPPADMSIPALVTWPEYQAQLIMKGVRPAPTPVEAPSYCAGVSTVTVPSS